MILVTGGTGVMGRALVARLRRDGYHVKVLTLPGDPAAPAVTHLGAQVVYGDISRPETIENCCDGVSLVYHLAAIIITFNNHRYDRINRAGTAHICAEARRSGTARIVYVSSASVVYPRTTAYSRSKRAAEKIVRSSGLSWTIVRPTLVYDCGRGSLEFDQFLNYLCRFPVVPFIGRGHARKRPVFVGDVIDGLTALADAKNVHEKIYHLSGGESITMIEFARLCLELTGRRGKPVVHLPVWFCLVLGGLAAVFMNKPPLRWPVIAGVTQDADLDPSDAIEDLGYCPAKVREKLPDCFPRDE